MKKLDKLCRDAFKIPSLKKRWRRATANELMARCVFSAICDQHKVNIEDIADYIGVDRTAFYYYKRKHTDFITTDKNYKLQYSMINIEIEGEDLYEDKDIEEEEEDHDSIRDNELSYYVHKEIARIKTCFLLELNDLNKNIKERINKK